MTDRETETGCGDQKRKEKYRHRGRSIFWGLMAAGAAAIFAAALWLPVLQIYGNSMAPTLREGEIVVAVKVSDLAPGDIISFRCANKILIKRIIGMEGDVIDLDGDGTVYVNGRELEEPYLAEKALGQCDIGLPYQVQAGEVFVMGDDRGMSVDSRSTSVGCVTGEQIDGKIIFRIWPLKRFGMVK